MPTHHPRLRLHRETVRRLDAAGSKRLATDPVAQPGDTAFCGPSRLSICETGCETAR